MRRPRLARSKVESFTLESGVETGGTRGSLECGISRRVSWKKPQRDARTSDFLNSLSIVAKYTEDVMETLSRERDEELSRGRNADICVAGESLREGLGDFEQFAPHFGGGAEVVLGGLRRPHRRRGRTGAARAGARHAGGETGRAHVFIFESSAATFFLSIHEACLLHRGVEESLSLFTP